MELPNHDFLELVLTAISTGLMFLFGHNFWITAKDEGEATIVEMITSDCFPESDAVLKRERIKDFRAYADDGDSFPAADFEIREKTLVARFAASEKIKLAALELDAHPIVLEAAKFAGYIRSEAAENSVAPAFVEGATSAPQRESYAKYAKTLIKNEAYAAAVGHQFEIVLQNNPARLKAGEKLRVKVLFGGAATENLRVSSGAENLNDGRYAAHALTDENGAAEIETARRGLCFVRTHLIRPHHDRENYEWESFWASITFRV